MRVGKTRKIFNFQFVFNFIQLGTEAYKDNNYENVPTKIFNFLSGLKYKQ